MKTLQENNSITNNTYKNFAYFDTSQFPRVYIKLNKSISSDEEYDKFTSDLLDLYKKQKYYNLVIDTTDTCMINIKYAFKLANFIKGLKKDAPDLYGEQWLQYSIILVSSNLVMKLLNIIFKITKPIAPVYIVSSENDKNIIINKFNNMKFEDYTHNIQIFKKCNSELRKKNINFKYIDSN